MTSIATVQVSVVLREQSDPGAIAVLLDLLEVAGLRSKWYVPVGTEVPLLDRLAFGGHDTTITNGEPPGIGADSASWLHEAQIELGRALQYQQPWELRIDTTLLLRRDGMSAVAEALDLVSGLSRAGRLRTDTHHVGQLDPEP